MNYAVIFAGGVGNRMSSREKPKQFLEIHGKPIIIHTLEYFQNHPEIDAISVVCVKEWVEYLRELLVKYHIEKVKWVVAGGTTALGSQYNGLRAIYDSIENPKDDHVVLIHDGVRPLIHRKTITDCIAAVKQYGSAITVAPATETIVRDAGGGSVCQIIPRAECMLARAPQCFFLHDIVEMHELARKTDAEYIDSASMMLAYGRALHMVEGPAENLKITTPADFYVCRALLDAREDLQIYGLLD